MSYTLKLRQKTGLLRYKPDLATLRRHFGAAVHIGGVGDYYTFKPEPGEPGEDGEVAYMLYGTASQLGRGFFLFIDKAGHCELRTPMPTTLHDLEDMFAFAGMLAKLLECDEVEADGRAVPRAGLVALYGDVKRHNGELLKSYVISGRERVMTTVKLPLRLPDSLLRRIESVPVENTATFLSSYLGDKQANDYTYIKPVFTRSEDGLVTGHYTLNEGEPSIIQTAPFVPYGPPPFGSEPGSWRITLLPKPPVTLLPQAPQPLGTLDYTEFTARLEARELQPFDGEHQMLRGLSLRRMKELAED